MLNSGWVCVQISVCVCLCVTCYRLETLSQLIKGRLLCPNLDTISVLRNVLHHNNDNVGKTGNTWLTTLYSDLLSVWQSVFHMMFVSHKQFQHGRVWCQDNSHIIRHCRTSMGLAKKIGFFYLWASYKALCSGDCFPRRAVLSFETWPSLALVMLSFQLIMTEMKSTASMVNNEEDRKEVEVVGCSAASGRGKPEILS